MNRPVRTFALVNFHRTYSTTGRTHCVVELDPETGAALCTSYGIPAHTARAATDEELRGWDTYSLPESVESARFEVLRTFLPNALASRLTGRFTLERLVRMAAEEPTLAPVVEEVSNRIGGYQARANQPGLELVAILRRGAIRDIRPAA